MKEPCLRESIEQPTQACNGVDELMPLVYQELRALAQSYLEHERKGHTLQATALVHEAYLRLVEQRSFTFRDRDQFVAVAATMIRRVLMDHARRRAALKRDAPRVRLACARDVPITTRDAVDLIALDDCLLRLARVDGRKARLVELRFFGGLTVMESARVLHVSERVAADDWAFARAWMQRQLSLAD